MTRPYTRHPRKLHKAKPVECFPIPYRIDPFCALPNELMLEIFSHLHLRDFKSCMLVSRKWNSLSKLEQMKTVFWSQQIEKMGILRKWKQNELDWQTLIKSMCISQWDPYGFQKEPQTLPTREFSFVVFSARPGVGKTSLVKSLMGTPFSPMATIGSEIQVFFQMVESQKTKVAIWDLPGAQCSLKPFDRIMASPKTTAFLVCIDLSASEYDAKASITQFRSKMSLFEKTNFRSILVGTKKDERKPQMTTTLVRKLAVDNGFEAFVETSAKDAGAFSTSAKQKKPIQKYNQELCQKPFDIAVELCKRFNPPEPKAPEKQWGEIMWSRECSFKIASCIGIISAFGLSVYLAAQASFYIGSQ